ncbi:MAG: MaoC family dehydratase [Bacteroidales bacterium]|nr:MaoC family dehydratase [Bacteroidales bacterium]
MEQLIINTLEEFEGFLGKEIGVSEWHQINQEQINKFADATLDFQWIHTDPERAAKETPFGCTIAHGYLTLSVLPYLWYQMVDFPSVKMMVNYGITDFKFGLPVKVNQKVRLRVDLEEIKNLRGIIRATMRARLEIEGEKKTAFDGKIIFLYHFE